MFTVPDAAKRLGVGLTKLRALIKDGTVQTRLLGKAKMVTASEIRRLAGEPSRTSSPSRAITKTTPKSTARRLPVSSGPVDIEAILRARKTCRA
jgi:hypothetical protein